MVEEFDECKLWVGVLNDCFIVVAAIADPPAFDEDQLTNGMRRVTVTRMI